MKYFELVNKGREKVLENQQTKQIIGDISFVPGVGSLDKNFINILGIRALLRGLYGKEIILPGDFVGLDKYSKELFKVLSLDTSKIKVGKFDTISDPKLREPYFKAVGYYPEIKEGKLDLEFRTYLISLLRAISYIGDKAYFTYSIKQIDQKLVPNTKFFFVRKEKIDSYPYWLINNIWTKLKNKENFIVKAGEGASGGNIIIFRYKKEKNEYEVIKNGKREYFSDLLSKEDIKNQLDEVMLVKYRKVLGEDGKINLVDQNYIIQDLIDSNKYKEKSINLFIYTTPEGEVNVYLTALSDNLTFGQVHIGNKEIIDIPNELFLKFERIIKKFIKNINNKFGIKFVGALGLDFFINNQGDIKIIEANPRYSAPLTPSILVKRLQEVYGIKKLTRDLIQKFEVGNINLWEEKDLPTDLRNYNILYNPKILEQEGYGFLPYTPPYLINGKGYQGIIILGKSIEQKNEIYKKLESFIN